MAHPGNIADFVKDDTEIIGINTMDPFGNRPTTMSYHALYESMSEGHMLDAYVKRDWEALKQE